MNRAIDTADLSMKYAVAAAVLLLALVLAGCPAPPTEEIKTPDRPRLTQTDIDSGAVPLMNVLAFGRALAIHNFTVSEGYGNGRNGALPPNFSRLVGPDATSCNSCHGLGNIIMGWGTNEANVLVLLDDPLTPTVAGSNERNTSITHGTGFIELLAKEMTFDLREQRQQALHAVATSGQPATVDLETKGVAFGSLTAHPDGTIDASGLDGCDADLRIRPFHSKGQVTSVRTFTRNALDRHSGIQSYDHLLRLDRAMDPARWDQDEDGVVDEMNEGEMTALTLYQVCLPAPMETGTGDTDVEAGRALMASMGCTECHLPSLRLESPVWSYTSDAGVTTEVDLCSDFLGTPRLHPDNDGSVLIEAWTDLKRHDLGPESHEPLDQPLDDTLPDWDGGEVGDRIAEALPPVPRELMMTTKLWGVGDTGPWWHDGSSPTIDDAIRRHGGEAEASRDAYVNATVQQRGQLLEFLAQLRIGMAGEVFIGSKENPDPRHLPLNRTTQAWSPAE